MYDLSDPNATPKLNALVVTAKELFYKFGIKRVSIDEICQKANVSKMTFYKHFANKIDLLLHILNKIYEQAFARYDEIFKSDVSFKNKVKSMIQLKEDYTELLSKEMYEELLNSPHPQVTKFIEGQQKRSMETFIQMLTEAQEKGDVRKDIRPEFVLYMTNHLVELGKDANLLALYSDAQELAVEMLDFLFYGLMPRDDEN